MAYAMCVSCATCILQFMQLRPLPLLWQQAPQVYGLSIVNAVFCTVLPVSTLFLGALILDEPITLMQLSGTGLVLVGIYLISKKKQ